MVGRTLLCLCVLALVLNADGLKRKAAKKFTKNRNNNNRNDNDDQLCFNDASGVSVPTSQCPKEACCINGKCGEGCAKAIVAIVLIVICSVLCCCLCAVVIGMFVLKRGCFKKDEPESHEQHYYDPNGPPQQGYGQPQQGYEYPPQQQQYQQPPQNNIFQQVQKLGMGGKRY